ncbi:hypothetical protein HY772_06620 [Candidatus Woesearchaeota archaeon]|nr:hypothetical protein [Candidatus Woesearchaeota archaeon]
MVRQGNKQRCSTLEAKVAVAPDIPGKEILIGPHKDKIFAMLAGLNVRENYFERTVAQGLEDEYSEGEERANKHPLIGAVIFEKFRGIANYLSHSPCSVHQSLTELEKRIVQEQGQDGGYIISSPINGSSDDLQISTRKDAVTITRKSIVRAHNKREARENHVNTFGELYAKCLPSDFLYMNSNRIVSEEERYNIGTRTQAAFAAAQFGGKKAYVLKQTVIDGTGVGKVALFDASGLRAEFFLYRSSREEIERVYGSLNDEDYFSPKQKVIGLLRTYGNDKFSEKRNEFVITPKDLGLSLREISYLRDRSAPKTERNEAHFRTPLDGPEEPQQSLYSPAEFEPAIV